RAASPARGRAAAAASAGPKCSWARSASRSRPPSRRGGDRRSTSGPRAAVAVRDPDDVVELRSGHLENVAVLQCDHPMPAPDWDVVRVALLQEDLLELTLLVLEDRGHRPLRGADRFLLPATVLKRDP